MRNDIAGPVCSAELAFETMAKLLLRAFPMHDNPLTVRYVTEREIVERRGARARESA